MRSKWQASIVLPLVVACAGGSPRVLVPPRLELAPYQRVGLVTFSVENAEGSLGEFATERFITEVFAAQGGVEVLELGDRDVLLEQVGADRLDAAAVRAIGEEHGVPALFAGRLVVSDVKPRAALGRFPGVEAEVSVSLRVRLLSTESGGTLWSGSARATQTVAELSLTGGVPFFAAQDPDDAYGDLVDHLVFEVTRDLRPTYMRG